MNVLRMLLPLLLAALLYGCGGQERLTIFYSSDAHGHITSGPDSIGLDRIAGIRRSVAEGGAASVLLVDAGDFLHGNSLANLEQGLAVLRLMKESGYYAAAVGNHEFSHGRPALAAAARLAGEEPPLHLLAANIRGEDGERLFAVSVAIELDGLKLCLFGLGTPQTLSQASPGAVAGLSFDSPRDCARQQVAELQGRGCAVIVALTHLGSDAQVPYKSTDLAADVPGLDLVIDGHSHLLLEERVGRTLVVGSGCHGQWLGRLDLTFDRRRGRLLEIGNSLLSPAQAAELAEPEPGVAAGLAELEARRQALLDEPLARSSRALPVEKNQARSREIGAGNLCADAMRRAYASDFAMLNGGNIRQGLPGGVISRGDIQDMLPFGDMLVEVQVSGAELKELFEHGLAGLPGAGGAFPQLSGLRLLVDAGRPAGQRVLAMTLPDGRELRPERLYRLTVNDFMADGGDGYPILAGKARLKSHISLEEAVIEQLRLKDAGSYLEPAGRIRIK